MQDNHSRSRRGVLRGLHYQIEHAQGKLVRVVAGEVFDVAVDLRRARRPSAARWRARCRPRTGGCCGFRRASRTASWSLSEDAEFLYKTTDYWYPEHERTLLWNDPALGIDWPLDGAPTLAAKDAAGVPLAPPTTYDTLIAARWRVRRSC